MFQPNKINAALITASLSVAISAGAYAKNTESNSYVSLSFGNMSTKSSSIDGSFTNGFITGAGTSVPGGTELAPDTQVGWQTGFKDGNSVNLAYGRNFDSFTGEIELSFLENDVDRHSGVTVADTLAIDGEDAGILITGSENLGATVGQIVADGKGQLDATYLMLNLYKPFELGSAFTPYLGAGLGIADVDVEYNPSDVGIISDSDKVLAYQLIAGGSFAINDNFAIYGQYRYRATQDVDVKASLFDADFSVENKSDGLEIGLKYSF